MTRADYAPAAPHGRSGACIGRVAGQSPAADGGLTDGDTILALDGAPVTDILDWQWRSDGDSLDLLVRDATGTERQVGLERTPDQPWGIEFADTIFDRVRTCRNSCAFCFMTQLPKGLRTALYLRDDDYRLSFLQGNFVTLTNLTDGDVSRIITMRLSPLYVSLHAVDPTVRAQLICAREDRALERVDSLLEGGIDLHAQIVLVPGVNDGAVLDETLSWLAEREGIESVGIVPLGYTGHQSAFSASYETPTEAQAVIDQVSEWQQAALREYDQTWVHVADEFYLNAHIEFPQAMAYDGFPQYENGIGLARVFIDEVEARRGEFSAMGPLFRDNDPRPIFVTGTLFGPLLKGVVGDLWPGADCVLEVRNEFFGGNVSVSGLLTGRDIANAVSRHSQKRPQGARYVICDSIFNAQGLTLDGMTLDQIAEKAQSSLRVVSCDAAGLLAGMRDCVAHADNLKE